MKISVALVSLLLIILSCQPKNTSDNPYDQWRHYGGTPDFIHYSALTQIDTTNVSNLRPVWVYHTEDADTASHSQIQCNPIIIGATLFGVTPNMKLFAIDASTGQHSWTFDPLASSVFDESQSTYHNMINSRGVAYWSDGKNDHRIFFTAGSYTYAVNAENGEVITSFGTNGYVDLHKGLDREIANLFVVSTSPGIVFEDILVMGTRVDEGTPSAPGHIRGYDVKTGEQKWIFHTIPQPGEIGYDTWENKNAWKYVGGANVWSGFSLDEKRGWIFCGTGSASYDFYGGKRKGENLFANCVLAIDIKTGQRKWHFQTVHHDIWDTDIPTAPALITIHKDGREIEAVAQPTKNGFLFVLDRETGEPIFEVVEQPFDTSSTLAGEQVFPTQPVPVKPAPFVRQAITPVDINPYLPDSSKAIVKKQFEAANYGHIYSPFSLKPTVMLPGFDGGAEWGGPAFDPETGIMYINSNEMAWYIKMHPNSKVLDREEIQLDAGVRLYDKYCRSCHATNRKGTGNNPGILAINQKYEPDEFVTLIRNGRRMMPAFNYLTDQEVEAISIYILEQEKQYDYAFVPKRKSDEELESDEQNYMPYKIDGYKKFLSPEGMPAISPPWGTLNAIDLNTGETLWRVPLGEYPEYKKRGIPPTGTENYGGPIATAGGLVFIAATQDGMMRAFHKKTGALLWEYQLPYAGFATPAMYTLNGKQYLVIACGGGKLGTKAGDAYVAFGF